MRLVWILLPILAQGAVGDIFDVEPPRELVVHQGKNVTLECIIKPASQCAWKVDAPDLTATGFLKSVIPGNLKIKARDKTSETDCTIIITDIDETYNGRYTCSPYTANGGQQDSEGTNLVIAKKPDRVAFLGVAASGLLEASVNEPASVECTAENSRPKAEIFWYLDNIQIYDNIEVDDNQQQDSRLWTSVSTLTYQFRREDLGKRLRCVASHAGYDKSDRDQEQRERTVEVNVEFPAYRPKGNNIGKLYGFTAGQQGEVTVNFTANPPPIDSTWDVGQGSKVSAGGESVDQRFRSGNIVTKNATHGMYSLTLTINPVMMEDQTKTFVLKLDNGKGATELQFQIGTGPAPPPSAVDGATIGGIVAAVIVLLIIIGLVAFGRSRGKWCFAGKDRTDKPAPARPVKKRRTPAPSVSQPPGGGGGSRRGSVAGGGGGGSRRNSMAGGGGRRGSRGAPGAGAKFPLSLSALKQSMSARPNRRRFEGDDGSVEVGREEVTYVNRPTTGDAGEEMEMTPAPLVREGTPAPASVPAPAPAPVPAEPTPLDIPELESPPRPIQASVSRLEPDLSAMPRTPPTPISPILFPTSQPPAAMSSPLSSEVDSPNTSRGPLQYPQKGFAVMGPPGVPPAGPPGPRGPVLTGPVQQRSQVGPPVSRPMGQPGSPVVQSGPPPMPPRGSEPDNRRGSGRSDLSDRGGSGPLGPGLYSNGPGPALPERTAGPRWSQPAGRQRTAMAPPSDFPHFSGAPSVDTPPVGSREELGIPYPPPGVVRRPGPPLPPKNRPQSQVPPGAIRVLPGAMQSELSARFPSSPSLLDPTGDGSAV